MHTEDSPLDRTPDLVTKIRTLREQAEKEMNQFTRAEDYEIRRVTGTKPKAETVGVPPATSQKKRNRKTTEQTAIDFASAPTDPGTNDGGEA